MDDFVAANELEIALQKAASQLLSMADFIGILLRSELAIPSAGEIMPDGSGFQPLLFDKEKIKMVACFTARERAKSYGDMTPYCLMMKGAEFIKRIPANYGIVINPGQKAGLDISPAGISRIKSEAS